MKLEMTKNTNANDAERQKARALARWEGEGGALGASKEPAHALDECDLRILARLGAALLDEWSNLPAPLQRAIFDRASALRADTDGPRIKQQITRFVHNHKES